LFSLVSPKSGRQNEVVFIPKKVAGRLREYIRSKNMDPEERIFPIGYTGARQIVKKAGKKIRIEISPMISGDMLQHMQAGPGHQLKMSAK